MRGSFHIDSTVNFKPEQPPCDTFTPPSARPIPLTDAPAIVELKRKFRDFDEEEETLKAQIDQLRDMQDFAKTALERVRLGKAEIAREIFNIENQPR